MTNRWMWRGPRSVRATSLSGRLVILGALVASSACARAPATPYPPDGPVVTHTARGPRCAPEPYPPALPAVGAVVDSARLSAAVQRLHGGVGARAGHVLLSLAIDELGVILYADVLEHTAPAMVADSVRRLADASFRELPESDVEWGVRLRVDVGESPGLALQRRELCRPIARDPRLHEAMLSYSPAGVRVRRGYREQTIHVRARVSDVGTITSATIVRGALSGGSLERDVLLLLRQFLFQPATIDGEPTASWLEIPVRVRMPA